MSAVVYERYDCGVVAVEGPETFSFLQSLVSQDLDGLADGASTRSLLLQPQGKLTAIFGLLRVSEELALLYTDEGFGPALADGLRRFKIRVKAEIDDRSGAWGVLSVRGDASSLDVELATDCVALPVAGGVDVVGPVEGLGTVRDALVRAGAAIGDHASYERARIEAGVPRQGVDVDERTIPQEAFLERDTVSFTKGCFLGQELVCRIDTRGHVNKYLRRLRVDGAVPEVGAAVAFDGKDVGVVTSVAPVDDGSVALAMVRREVEPPATVVVRWAEESAPAAVTAVNEPAL
jgi:tRNA-modifying protein YgfZ